MKLSKLYIIPLLFILSICFASATVFVATTDSIYKSSDDVTFSQVFKLTNYTSYASTIYPTSFGTPTYLNQSTIIQLAVTEDAQTIYALVSYNNSLSYLVHSYDGGVTWTPHGSSSTPYNNNYGALTMMNVGGADIKVSDNGQYVYIITNPFVTVGGYIAGNSYLFRSQDFGSTYSTTNLGAYTTGSIVVSKTGQYVDIGGGQNAIYVSHSNDYGLTYTTTTMESLGGNKLASYVNAISPSGQYHLLLFIYSAGFLRNFVGSSDYGATWTNSTAFNPVICSQPSMVMGDDGRFTFLGSSGIGSPCNSIGTGTNVNNKSSVTYYPWANGIGLVGTYDLSTLFSGVGNTLYKFLNNNLTTPINVTSFTSTIISVVYSPEVVPVITPICMDSHTYCSNPIYYTSGATCDNSDIQNCAQGCDDSTGIAICTNTCTNNCTIIGSTSCYDSTSVAKCDDWNSDGCFEYRPYLTCAVGQFCLGSGNYFASCVNTTESGTHGVYGLSVIPYSTTESGNVTYLDNPTTRTISVSTSYLIHRQDFYTQGTNYISRTCDYSEPVIISTGYALVTNYGNDSVQYLPSATSSDTIIRLSFRPSNYSEGWIWITDTLGSVNSKFYYQRNFSAKRLTIYDSSLNIIYNDYSTNSYDDLESVDLEYSFQFITKTYTVKATFNRAIDNVRVIGAQTFLGTNIYKINVSQFIDNESTVITQLAVSNPTPYTTFTSSGLDTTTIEIENPNCNCGVITCTEYRAIKGAQAYFDLCLINQTIPVFKLPCDYSTTGAHYVRTYGNDNGVPDFSTYSDYTVVVNGLGLTSGEVDNANPDNFVSGGGLADYMKWIIVALTILVITGAFIVIGYETESMKMSTIIGAVIDVFAILIYTLIGWISAWILVAIVIFSLAIVIIFGSMKANASGV